MGKASTLVKKGKPRQEWQTGEYERDANFHFFLPYPFLLLCKLMEVTPEDLMRDFASNLSFSGHERTKRGKALEHLVNYFIELGYGQQHYTAEDIRQMFREMDAVSLLFPANADDKMLDLYAKWRDEHWEQWFRGWYGKLRRPELPIL